MTMRAPEGAKAVDWAQEAQREMRAKRRLEAALTEIRDLMPLQNDEYARRVFRIAANALEPE
jgi:hypothetical protein